MTLLTAACASPPGNPLARALAASQSIQPLLDNAEHYRLQIVLGVVTTNRDGQAVLRQYGFRAGDEYFYPASSVKLFAAVAAAQELERLRLQSGEALTLDTPMIFYPLFDGEVREDRDESNIDGAQITIRQQIRKIFLVSDNQAYNYLYEFAGQDGIARSMHAAGLDQSRIVQRLSEARSVAEDRQYPRIDFVAPGVSYSRAARTSTPLPPLPDIRGLLVGEKYFADGQLHEGPMDFANKNRVPLRELQRGLCKLVQPQLDCGGPAFELTPDARNTMLESMSQYPRQSRNPRYDAVEYPDGAVKGLLPGVSRVVPREHIRIYNKTGAAYGFSIENAWVEDISGSRGFFLAATLYTNADGVLNDDIYDYATIAKPFMADLGEAVARELWRDPD